MEKKPSTAFICFDIVDFYPSISHDLLIKALHFASRKNTIKEQELDLIMHTKKSLLFTPDNTWVKTTNKDGENFDVTMGSYDGAETCELIGLYLLHELRELHGQSIGLYRDDGLAMLNGTPREIENTKKRMCELFKKHGLKITIEANKKVVNYLDVTLDINQNTYRPYKKPNDTPLYVHNKSNHPPSIIRNIPKGINKRLAELSASNAIFKAATPEYQHALKSSGHKHVLTFEGHQNEKRNVEQTDRASTNNNSDTEEGQDHNKPRGTPPANNNRRRKIIWYNPPFEGTVDTNIGKEFFKILDDSFPASHKLQKIFNRSSIKLSYSCMPNLKQIIDGANKRKSQQEPANSTASTNNCNCRKPDECPLQKQCTTSGIVYQATVTVKGTNQTATYVGMTETSFKLRYANHKQSFKQERYRTQTELSKHIWSLKDAKTTYDTKWRILQRARPYSTGSKKCNLCTAEKYYILCKPEMASLNTRAQMVSTCIHRKKHLLTYATQSPRPSHNRTFQVCNAQTKSDNDVNNKIMSS